MLTYENSVSRVLTSVLNDFNVEMEECFFFVIICVYSQNAIVKYLHNFKFPNYFLVQILYVHVRVHKHLNCKVDCEQCAAQSRWL